jgi:hypothetical protein
MNEQTWISAIDGHYLRWPSSKARVFVMRVSVDAHEINATISVSAWDHDTWERKLCEAGDSANVYLAYAPGQSLDDYATFNVACIVAAGCTGRAHDRALYALWWSLLRREDALRAWVFEHAPDYARVCRSAFPEWQDPAPLPCPEVSRALPGASTPD